MPSGTPSGSPGIGPRSFVTWSCVAVAIGLAAGFLALMSATAPATCGAAKLVPMSVMYWLPGNVV